MKKYVGGRPPGVDYLTWVKNPMAMPTIPVEEEPEPAPEPEWRCAICGDTSKCLACMAAEWVT